MRWVEHVARTKYVTNAYKTLVGAHLGELEPDGMTLLKHIFKK